MQKVFGIIFTLLTFTLVFAETPEVTGQWLLTKAEVKGKVVQPYQIFEFKPNGKLMAMGMEMAAWQFDATKRKIVLKSYRKNDFNGAMKIVKITPEQMILQKAKDVYTYARVQPDKVKKNNKQSGLTGLWTVKGTEYPCAFLKLDVPQDFSLVRVASGETDRVGGSWIFNPEDQAIIFVGFSHLLRGKVKLADIQKDGFTLQLADRALKAQKVKPAPIERLSFKEDDFPEEADEQSQARLPWKEFDGMVQFLNTVKAVGYSYGQLLPKLNVLAYPGKRLSKIQADAQKSFVKFTNLNISEGNASQFSEKVLNDMAGDEFHFFPLDDFWQYRVAGVEKLTVPAGTFDCTVVEAVDGDKKFKLWMINDKPGIYAKIIREETDPFGKISYSVQELEKVEFK